ncbi:MAG: glycosyltransferase family 4 protein, partial [Chloroflexi bacterium]|nr:glycosyltransferase family 4 protein [Chloroflexota bacterium]
ASGDVPAEMRRLHTFVLPSHTTPRWKEQFGRVLIEAMASGVPPIGSDSGEIPHVIGDGGLIFGEGKVEELVAQIQKLIDQPALREELAQKGRQRALDHYTQRALARRYYEVYGQMLESA